MNNLLSSNHGHWISPRWEIGFVVFLLLSTGSNVCHSSPSSTLIFSTTKEVLTFFETTSPRTVRPEDVLAGIKFFWQGASLGALDQGTLSNCAVHLTHTFPQRRFAFYSQRYFYDSWWVIREPLGVFLENTLRWIKDFPDEPLGVIALDELEKYARVVMREDFFSTDYPARIRAMHLPKGSLTQVAFEAKGYSSTWRLKEAKVFLDSLRDALGPRENLVDLRDDYALLDMLEGTKSAATEVAGMIIQDGSAVKGIQQILPEEESQRAGPSMDDPVTYCERQRNLFALGQLSAEVVSRLYQARLPGLAHRWKEQSCRLLVPAARAVGFPSQPQAQELLDELDGVDISSTTDPVLVLGEALQAYNSLCELRYPEKMPEDLVQAVQLEEVPLESVKHRLKDCAGEVFSSIKRNGKGVADFTVIELLTQANTALKDWEEVVRIAQWAIVNMPGDDAAGLTLDSVRVLSAEKQYQRILGLGEFFLREKTDLPIGIEVLFAMGRANYQLDRPEEAIARLEDYLKSGKAAEPVEAEFLKALCLMKLSDYSSASQVLEGVASSMDNRTKASQALFLAGQCYLLERRYEEAKQVFEQIVSVYPYSPQASGAEKMLEKLKVFVGPGPADDK